MNLQHSGKTENVIITLFFSLEKQGNENSHNLSFLLTQTRAYENSPGIDTEKQRGLWLHFLTFLWCSIFCFREDLTYLYKSYIFPYYLPPEIIWQGENALILVTYFAHFLCSSAWK